MQRVCAKCGGQIPPKTNRGKDRKYCLDCSPPRGRSPQKKPAKPRPVKAETIVSATRAELAAAGVDGTSSGLAAILLAERIASNVDSGSSLAQLVRQHRESVAFAIGDAEPAQADPLDELKSRRERRSS